MDSFLLENFPIGQNKIESISLIWNLVIFVIIGSIIISILGTLIFFIPAAVISGVVWYITGNQSYAGIAFLLVAILSIIKRK
jgi:hypothetical protein